MRSVLACVLRDCSDWGPETQPSRVSSAHASSSVPVPPEPPSAGPPEACPDAHAAPSAAPGPPHAPEAGGGGGGEGTPSWGLGDKAAVGLGG